MLETKLACWLLLFALGIPGEGLEQGILPSGVFRDDVLFDLSWPGPSESDSNPPDPRKQAPLDYDSQLNSEEEGVIRNQENLDKEEAVEVPRTLSDVLLPEEDYDELNYIDMRTGTNEEYRCIVPQILSWEFNQVGVVFTQ